MPLLEEEEDLRCFDCLERPERTDLARDLALEPEELVEGFLFEEMRLVTLMSLGFLLSDESEEPELSCLIALEYIAFCHFFWGLEVVLG